LAVALHLHMGTSTLARRSRAAPGAAPGRAAGGPRGPPAGRGAPAGAAPAAPRRTRAKGAKSEGKMYALHFITMRYATYHMTTRRALLTRLTFKS